MLSGQKVIQNSLTVEASLVGRLKNNNIKIDIVI